MHSNSVFFVFFNYLPGSILRSNRYRKDRSLRTQLKKTKNKKQTDRSLATDLSSDQDPNRSMGKQLSGYYQWFKTQANIISSTLFRVRFFSRHDEQFNSTKFTLDGKWSLYKQSTVKESWKMVKYILLCRVFTSVGWFKKWRIADILELESCSILTFDGGR